MRALVKYLLAIVLCLVGLGISQPVAAQDVPMVEVSGGYNFLKGSIPVFSGRDVPPASSRSVTYGAGWYADLAINTPKPNKMLGLVVQISGNPKTLDGYEASQTQYMAGVRLNKRNMGNSSVFAHLLGGVTNSKFGNVHATEGGFDEWTGFYTLQIGAGATMMATEQIGFRVGADFLQIHGKHDSTILNENFNEMRIAAGIVLPFGTR